MKNKITLRLAPVGILVAALFTPALPAAAAEPDILLDPGVGCPGFALGVSWSGGKLHTKEFSDKDGDLVRVLTAGKGVLLTYANYGPDPDPGNLVAGESVTIRTDGSVNSTRVNADGTLTVTATGHNGLIMYPSDQPSGPTATQYIGQLVYNVNPNTEVFTFVSSSGQALDVCKALS